jgi:hypothetical protein
MSALPRILLVEENRQEWGVALAALSENEQMNQTVVVKDKAEALDFLHSRGAFRQRPVGLPAVVVLGPSLSWHKALSLLSYIRHKESLLRVPVVLVQMCKSSEMVRDAYAHGANSVVRWHGDGRLDSPRYAAIGLFWAGTNEPPPGCIGKVGLRTPPP